MAVAMTCCLSFSCSPKDCITTKFRQTYISDHNISCLIKNTFSKIAIHVFHISSQNISWDVQFVKYTNTVISKQKSGHTLDIAFK